MKIFSKTLCILLSLALIVTVTACEQPVAMSSGEIAEISSLTDVTSESKVHYSITIESSQEAKHLDYEPAVEFTVQLFQNPAMIGDSCDYANMRESASVTSAVVGRVPTGGIVDILSDVPQNGYLLAASNGIQGYVYENTLIRGQAFTDKALEEDRVFAVVTAEKTRLCMEPEEDTVVMASLDAGQEVEILQVLSDYYEVIAGDAVGYLLKEDCTLGYSMAVAESVYVPGLSLTSTDSAYDIVSPAPAIQNTSAVEIMIAYAEQFMGVPYVFGGSSLQSGLDCSSFTMQVFQNSVGLSIPRTSYSQCYYGTGIAVSERQRGDLLFYAYKSTNVNHVAIYIGDNKILHCNAHTNSVAISDYNYCGEPVICRRFF